MNYFVDCESILGGLSGPHFDPDTCPICDSTPSEKRRIPLPWLGDVPPLPKDFIWDSGGWECDCYHVKVLDCPLRPYGTNTAMPGVYLEVTKSVIKRWQGYAMEYTPERVSVWQAGGYKHPSSGVWYSGKFVRVDIIPGPRVGQAYALSYRGVMPQSTYPSAATALAACLGATFYLQRTFAVPTYGTSDKLLYRGKVDYSNTLYGEECIQDGEQTSYRMTAHSIRATAPYPFLENISSACADAYYDALKGTKAKMCDNTIQNVVALMVVGAGIGACINYARRNGIKALKNALCVEVGNAISDLSGFTSPGAQVMIGRGSKTTTSWLRKAAYKVSKQQKAATARTIRNTARTICAAWLGYHYAYSTSVADAEDALKYVDRQIRTAAAGMDHPFRSYGVCKYTNEFGRLVTVRCRIRYRNKDIPKAMAYWDSAWRQGIELNPYVLWDSIPLSFVADWFLPVGDYASVISDLPHLTMFIDMLNICYSLEYDHEVDGVVYNFYSRWHNNKTYPIDDIVAGMQLHDGSQATAFRRINDTISLTIGGNV